MRAHHESQFMKNGADGHYYFRKVVVVLAHPHANGSLMFRSCDKRAKVS